MANGVTVYDYDEIDAVVSRLLKEAGHIQEEADRLYKSVKGSMSDWTGATADAYESRSTDLKSDLEANVSWLQTAGSTMKTGADDMQEQDRSSAKGLLQGGR
jgi:WXG100 family type VII secretion target